jgi:Telomere resolvase
LPLTQSPFWLRQNAFWPLLSASVPIRCPRAHTATKDALNNEVKLAFGQGDLSWKPGHLRSAYGAICCHRFKPKNMTDDIFLAQILGHKLLPGAAALSVGQSYKDFYVVRD